MTKIVAFSGAHGTGKTTVLEAIKALNNPKIAVDDFKFSRSILKDLDQTLEEATSTISSTKSFQTRILKKKQERILDLKLDSLYPEAEIILVDRSVADLYAYTALWAEKHTGLTDYLSEYFKACRNFINNYDRIIYFPINKIPFIDDGIRAKKEDQEKVDERIRSFLLIHQAGRYLQSSSVEDRVDEVLTYLEIFNAY